MATTEAVAAPLTICLFGPLRVLVQGQPLPSLRSRKAQWLLALLALRHGRAVEREWLAGILWPEVNQSQAFANLRPALSELRKAMGSEGTRLQSPSRLSLLLDLTGADVDVVLFDTAMALKTPSAMELAVSLYRGTLLEGCTEEWVVQDREARRQECLKALQVLATAAVAAGDPEVATAYWRRAVTLDSLWEVARRGLMEALRQSGNSNEALRVYREFLTLLQTDDPRAVASEETVSLYHNIRSEARRKATVTAKGSADEVTTPRVSGSLNQAVTELVGRDDERLEVAERLRRSRLVTLTGPGGIGKTRLAAAVAHESAPDYPHGAWLIPLESLPAYGAHTESSDEGSHAILQQIALLLDVKAGTRHLLREAVIKHLQSKRLLLVLDNCEHVVQQCAEVVSHLLRECSGLRILATSREALRVSGESLWPVPALATPDPFHLPPGGGALSRALAGFDAVQLFVERAEASCKSFALNAVNARDVAWLCSRLGGMPLALELAAARVGVLTPAQILEQLDARPLDALTSRQRDTAPRHRTLRATLEWSFGLLSPEAQRFLVELGVFHGGWTLAAAQAICPEADVIEMLTLLQDTSLLNATAEQEGSRFSLLETVRQFAAEALERSDRADALRQRHAQYYVRWLRENFYDWKARKTPDIVLRFPVQIERDYANIRATFVWARDSADTEMLVELCFVLNTFWDRGGRIDEGRAWLETTVHLIEKQGVTGDPLLSLRGSHREVRISFYYAIGDLEASAQLNLEVFEDIRRAGNPVQGRTYLFHAAQFRMLSDLRWALRVLQEECLPLERAAKPDGRANPVILSTLAFVSRLAGHAEQAASYLRETLDLCRGREEADPNGYKRALLYAGRLALFDGDFPLAQGYFETCLSIARNTQDTLTTALMLCHLATVLHETGDREQERRFLAEASAAAGAGPTLINALLLRRWQAELLLAEGDRAGARALVLETLSLVRGKALSYRLSIYPLLLLLADEVLPHHEERAARLIGAAEEVADRLGLVTPEWADRKRAERLRITLASRTGQERLAGEEATRYARDDEAALEMAWEPD